MSIPITHCLVYKAASSDEYFEMLMDRLDYNKSKGSMSIYPCNCTPPCKAPSDSKMNRLLRRMEEHEARQKRGTSQSTKRKGS